MQELDHQQMIDADTKANANEATQLVNLDSQSIAAELPDKRVGHAVKRFTDFELVS
jgi:hypothetical protein